jgi:hypothetical protein
MFVVLGVLADAECTKYFFSGTVAMPQASRVPLRIGNSVVQFAVRLR